MLLSNEDATMEWEGTRILFKFHSSRDNGTTGMREEGIPIEKGDIILAAAGLHHHTPQPLWIQGLIGNLAGMNLLRACRSMRSIILIVTIDDLPAGRLRAGQAGNTTCLWRLRCSTMPRERVMSG